MNKLKVVFLGDELINDVMNAKNIALNSLSMLFFGAAVQQFSSNWWIAGGLAVLGILCQVAYDYLP